MRKVPVIDPSRCNDCQSCIELCPGVFRKNKETGAIEIIELPDYPEDEVEEAMSMCPEDCISWEEK
ncbi:MAG: ferredoxin [Deltaproteobacteria bacterium]|nr:ferredoxin [Deltaproteobacteria bacterium]MBW2067206.1 ferredoxin [Deltaproteobacteria bacterium]